ncbi:MAG: HAMP domain-containing histidine kinase [Planctomycetaceae bacterium]|nr:HAMP domain-containing histidine kinase [Planctomycetaceae bacterium]
MKRPWQIWLAFVLCGFIVAAAMGWLTVHALRVDRARSVAQGNATLEKNVSLALWRMDTKLAPLIAAEAMRPHELYESFIATTPATKGGPTVDLVPSPLLTNPPENVLLNFQCGTAEDWSSPQAPPAGQLETARDNGLTAAAAAVNRAKLSRLANIVDVSKLLQELPKQPLPSSAVTQSTQSRADAHVWAMNTPFYDNSAQINAPPADRRADEASVDRPPMAQPAHQAATSGVETIARAANEPREQGPPAQQQLGSSSSDIASRGYRYQQAAEQEFNKQQLGNYSLWEDRAASGSGAIEYVSRPVWIGNELLLARRVDRDGKTFVQGSWLDWLGLKNELLAESADLLPGADLVPVRNESEADPTRMLAGLPVKLVVGEPAAGVHAGSAIDAPLQWALSFGWMALALALGAVALLLRGVMALSERRAAFVSSVTHELRTPLTTFRLYADLLARDMAPTPERRREYLETLRTEAERLTHLVENVLAYARLERGRAPQRTARITPATLIDRLEPRLAERAAQAGMTLARNVDESSAGRTINIDVGVVEQIMFNLVDNAAKYAARAADRRIVLSTASDGKFVALTIRDYGPGFSSTAHASCSAPFSKSAEQAAESAPGVGLGLALCRRLAKEVGGRLDVSGCEGERGAVVTLRLPVD